MNHPRRRLATIMFSDMVGYSALAQRNEVLALDLLAEYRRILRELFDEHHGREMDAIGDGFFVEFSSAVDAARCAIAIQRKLSERNGTAAPERRIHVRIGLHLGDVVVEGERVLGDNVNIAARIEALASPGDVLLSGDVARQIQNRIDVRLEKLGSADLKNIKVPVDIFRIGLPGERTAPWLLLRTRFLLQRRYALAWTLAGVAALAAIVGIVVHMYQSSGTPGDAVTAQRLAVLPFSNLSDNPKDEYFVDGMTEELISRLARVGGLDVIARTSVMQYKGKGKGIAEIGAELNVDRVLEGSVRREGDKLRITAQLIDVETQRYLWSEDYDRQIEDVFGIQSEVARSVVDALQVRLRPSDERQLDKKGTSSVEAYELYLQGLYHQSKVTPEGLKTSLRLFAQAHEQDPKFARAHAAMANSFELLGVWGLLPPREAFSQAKAAALRALELDESVVEAYVTLGAVRIYLDLDWAGAEKAFRRALSLDPSSAIANDWMAINFLGPKGRHKEAVSQMKRAMELDPLSSLFQTDAGWIYWCGRRYDEASEHFRRAIQREPTLSFAYEGLGYCSTALGKHEDSIAAMAKEVELTGESGYALAALGWAYAQAGNGDEARKILGRMESRGQDFAPFSFALIHSGLGDGDKAFAWLERAYKERDFQRLMYVNCGNWFDPVRSDPRFVPFLRKVGLID